MDNIPGRVFCVVRFSRYRSSRSEAACPEILGVETRGRANILAGVLYDAQCAA